LESGEEASSLRGQIQRLEAEHTAAAGELEAIVERLRRAAVHS